MDFFLAPKAKNIASPHFSPGLLCSLILRIVLIISHFGKLVEYSKKMEDSSNHTLKVFNCVLYMLMILLHTTYNHLIQLTSIPTFSTTPLANMEDLPLSFYSCFIWCLIWSWKSIGRSSIPSFSVIPIQHPWKIWKIFHCQFTPVLFDVWYGHGSRLEDLPFLAFQ